VDRPCPGPAPCPAFTDSPASPDAAQVISGSPLKIIPRSPQQEVVELLEDEDQDEDLLYLRLIALRSLAVEDKKQLHQGELDKHEENKMAVEMRELLEEAEVAATEDPTNTETAVISEVITIEDSDDDPISEMKLNLHESYLKYKQTVDDSDVVEICSPTYSAPGTPPPKTQPSSPLSPYSPSQSLSPVLSPAGPGPPLVDLTGLASPPPLPPLPPSPARPPLPPSPVFPDPVPVSQARSVELGRPADSQPCDMELDTGDDAETQFFHNQNLFPASVWGFSDQSTRPVQVRRRKLLSSSEEVEELDIQPSSEATAEETEESDSECCPTIQPTENCEEVGDKGREKIGEKDEVDELEEETLRSMLLAQVSKGKNSVRSNKRGMSDLTDDIRHKSTEIKENIKPKLVKRIKKSLTLEELSRRKTEEIEKQNAHPKSVASSRLNSPSSATDNASVRLKPKTKQLTISKADQKKYFPNLSKRVIVNLTEQDSDSDSEEEDVVIGKPGGRKQLQSTNQLFGLNLEAFLREARNTSKPFSAPIQSKSLQKKNVKKLSLDIAPNFVKKKKIALTPKLKAQALKLTLADKKKLISAQISHLSKSKQLEYQRLKAILEKKSTEKKEKLAKKKELLSVSKPTIVANGESKVNERVPATEIPETPEETLRMQLINSMRNSKKTDSPKKLKHKDKTDISKNSSKSISANTRKENITVKLFADADGRNVKIYEGKTDDSIDIAGIEQTIECEKEKKADDNVETSEDKDQSLPETGALEVIEASVVEMRSSLSAALFKLSACMSQLQKETTGVESAEKYAEELRRQLADTCQLVELRQRKVDSLRDVITQSHQQITVLSGDMARMEEECRQAGTKLRGPQYEPPVDGAENIKKKLEMIQTTALKVKTTHSGAVSSEEVDVGEAAETISGGGRSESGPDYSSPLEHLVQASRQDRVQLDHTRQICRFELAGKCLDDKCEMQHLGSV